MAPAQHPSTGFLSRIAEAMLPRNRRAKQHIMRAHRLLSGADGNRQQHVEDAISTLEGALEMLPSQNPPESWILGQRLLGTAYLAREAGDIGDNIGHAINAFEAAQKWAVVSDNLDAWTATQANLGQAYLRYPDGDALQNREKAAAALEAILSLPLEADWFPHGWGAALAWLTRLESVGADHRFASRPAESPVQGELSRDTEWHVPWYLEDALHDKEQALIEFIGTGEMPVRNEASRLQLGVHRVSRLAEMLRMLEERNSARQRTESLFEEIRTGSRPFVLFLRGFNNRVTSRTGDGVVLTGTGDLEFFYVQHLVKSISPMPVVWIGNPVESGGIDQLVAGVAADELGFRVEVGEAWERAVAALITSASFIVMHNKKMTPGVLAEIAMIRDAGRLGDTFFDDTEAANRATKRTDCRPLDEHANAALAGCTTARAVEVKLPEVMCPWVEGVRREAMELETQAAAKLLERLESLHHPMLVDLMLDAIALMLGRNVVLEQYTELAANLARQAALFRSLGDVYGELATASSFLEQRVRESNVSLRPTSLCCECSMRRDWPAV